MSPVKKVSLFVFLTVLLSSVSYTPMIRAGTIAVEDGLFVFTLMWSPALAAILTQLIATRSLRGLGWRFGQARWLGLGYILPLLYILPVYAITWLTGLGVFPNPTRIAKLAAQYGSSNVVTTLTIFLLFTLTVDMIFPPVQGQALIAPL